MVRFVVFSFRESIQNSLDAKSPNNEDPVKMKFTFVDASAGPKADIAKEAGVKFNANQDSTSIALEPIVAPIQFDGSVRRAIFERQQQ